MNKYHCVFNTYKNKHVLSDPEVVSFLYSVFIQIAEEKGFIITACSILADHVHCLIDNPAGHRLDYLMRMLKGISARRFFKQYRTNRLKYRKLWARLYFAKELLNHQEIESAKKYINEQKDIYGIDKRLNIKLINKKEPTVSLSGCARKEKEPTVSLSGPYS